MWRRPSPTTKMWWPLLTEMARKKKVAQVRRTFIIKSAISRHLRRKRGESQQKNRNLRWCKWLSSSSSRSWKKKKKTHLHLNGHERNRVGWLWLKLGKAWRSAATSAAAAVMIDNRLPRVVCKNVCVWALCFNGLCVCVCGCSPIRAQKQRWSCCSDAGRSLTVFVH